MTSRDDSLRQAHVHYSPLLPPTAGFADSQDALLSDVQPEGDIAREAGSSVADAPSQTQQVPADNLSGATNQGLEFLHPLVLNDSTLAKHPDYKKYDDLKFWPTILQPKAITLLIVLYLGVAGGLGLLLWRSKVDEDHHFELSSENVRMISRYFPSIVGTITVLLYRQTVREALRMEPFTRMADQDKQQAIGTPPAEGVGGAWFPWQDVTTAPASFFSVSAIVVQIFISFLVSLKVALLASKESVNRDTGVHQWILTVRGYPAIALIAMYLLMTLHTIYLCAWHFKGRSTGLKWDPVSIADFAALFAHCNALQYFAPLELRHDLRPEHIMPENRLFRLGYWTRKRGNTSEKDVVYGVGVSFSAHQGTQEEPQLERKPLGRSWLQKLTFRKSKPKPLQGLCKSTGQCAWGSWPKCEHYPYNQNPGCSRLLIFFCSILPMAGLAFSIYLLASGKPFTGFELNNNLRFPSKITLNIGNGSHTLPPFDPTDPNSDVLVWALLFRSAPTYVAGIFTSTIISWIDLNMRFMQPFRNMMGEDPNRSFWQRVGDYLGLRHRRSAVSSSQNPRVRYEEDREPAKASDSILLAYISVSPAQVPLTAWDNGHFKVCIYSTLNTLSPLFPIFIGAIVTVSPNDDFTKVKFTFSLSAYIGVMVFLFLFSTLLPLAIPGAYRLLPRQLYSLADLMALCHESKFMASVHLDIADPDRTPKKAHMEARILLEDSYFLFGSYLGRDGNRHIGFDVTQQRKTDFGPMEVIKRSVLYISPEGLGEKVSRTVTGFLEDGRGMVRNATSNWRANPRSPFSQRTHGILDGVGGGHAYELAPTVGEATGSQVESSGAVGENRFNRTAQASIRRPSPLGPGVRKPLPVGARVQHYPYGDDE